ncbi:MAG: tetratricopeptide repeat protein [Geminicoccaceae bacterium]
MNRVNFAFCQSDSISERYLGKNHPKVALRLNSLAELLRETGEFEVAEQHFVRSLDILEKKLPDDHPHIAVVSNNFAYLLDQLGRG